MEKENKTNIYTLLEQLEKRKAMFLGNGYRFQSLESFITGYTLAASEDQLSFDHYPNFTHFSTWLIGHLEDHFGEAGGWHWQITNRNPNNDDKAFQEFFYFLDIFIKSEVHSKSFILDKASLEFAKTSGVKRYKYIDGDTVLIDTPISKITWTTIDHSTTVWLSFFDQNENSLSDSWEIKAEDAQQRLISEFGSHFHVNTI